MARGDANRPVHRRAGERQRARVAARDMSPPTNWNGGRWGDPVGVWPDDEPWAPPTTAKDGRVRAGQRSSSTRWDMPGRGKRGRLRRLLRNTRDRTWWTRRRIVTAAVLTCVLLCAVSGSVDAITRGVRIASEASAGLRH